MSLSNLPFTLETNIDFNRATFSGDLRLELIPAVASPDLEPSKEVLGVFFDAVSMNFFFATPGISTCRPCVSKTNDPLVFECAVQNIPPHCLCVLLGLWAQTFWAGDEILTVKINLNSSTPRKTPPCCDAARIFSKPPYYAFTVDIPTDLDEFSPLEMMVTFENEIDPDQVEQVRRLFEVWGFLDAMGGFDFGYREQEDFLPEFGEVAHLEPNVVTYSKSRLNGPLSALHALYNGLANFNLSGPKISTLQIEA